MAEVVGLAVGFLGLAGLFSTCVGKCIRGFKNATMYIDNLNRLLQASRSVRFAFTRLRDVPDYARQPAIPLYGMGKSLWFYGH
jgi:hypothetical protein